MSLGSKKTKTKKKNYHGQRQELRNLVCGTQRLCVTIRDRRQLQYPKILTNTNQPYRDHTLVLKEEGTENWMMHKCGVTQQS